MKISRISDPKFIRIRYTETIKIYVNVFVVMVFVYRVNEKQFKTTWYDKKFTNGLCRWNLEMLKWIEDIFSNLTVIIKNVDQKGLKMRGLNIYCKRRIATFGFSAWKHVWDNSFQYVHNILNIVSTLWKLCLVQINIVRIKTTCI